jgi:acyl-CoA reductase-like NAD-dependent aldehyde dehydrogenase
MKYRELRSCVGGAFVGADLPLLDVYDPTNGTVISRVPLSAAREVDAAVARCSR